jgi:hypothetical protein
MTSSKNVTHLSHFISFLEVTNTVELDLFGIEVKSRKMIHDLINPLVERMNEERALMTA